MNGQKEAIVMFNGVIIPAPVCEVSSDYFNAMFEANLSEGETHEETYKRLEKSHVDVFQKRKYSSYDSFRKVRARIIKNRSRSSN